MVSIFETHHVLEKANAAGVCGCNGLFLDLGRVACEGGEADHHARTQTLCAAHVVTGLVGTKTKLATAETHTQSLSRRVLPHAAAAMEDFMEDDLMDE